MLTLLAAAAAGLVCGVLSGFGIGGGSLLMVWMTAVLAMEQKAAQGINLLYYVAAASPSLLFHLRHGLVEKKGGAIALCLGIPGCAAGAFLARWIEPQLLRRLFGVLLLYIGARELFAKAPKKEPAEK